jgi:hypothetical protein
LIAKLETKEQFVNDAEAFLEMRAKPPYKAELYIKVELVILALAC